LDECFYQTARLRNCLFEQDCGLFIDPGWSTLNKVYLAVALVCVGLLALALLIHIIQKKRSANAYVQV
jgi:hypothetical protein